MRPEIEIATSRGANSLDVVRNLRYLVLREPLQMPFESTLFAGDELESTLHIIGSLHQVPVGCLTLLVPARPHDFDNAAPESESVGHCLSHVLVQLRGMAVHAKHQGTGIGGDLLRHVHGLARENDWHLWCNAREQAVRFYAKLGWRVDGESFDVPGIGMHFKMFWERSD